MNLVVTVEDVDGGCIEDVVFSCKEMGGMVGSVDGKCAVMYSLQQRRCLKQASSEGWRAADCDAVGGYAAHVDSMRRSQSLMSVRTSLLGTLRE